MRIIFMGTPDFAVPSHKFCWKRLRVAAVVTATDKLGRGGKQLLESAVEEILAVSRGLPRAAT